MKNLIHLQKNYGKYVMFLVSAFIIVTFSVALSYLAATQTEVSYFLYSLLVLGIIIAVATILFNAFRKHLPKDFPSPTQMLMTIVFVIPSTIFKIIMNDISKTSYSTWMVVLVEVIVLFAYFILPIIINWLYLKNPGDKVGRGESVLVVESDKADMDVESFQEGFLAAVLMGQIFLRNSMQN